MFYDLILVDNALVWVCFSGFFGRSEPVAMGKRKREQLIFLIERLKSLCVWLVRVLQKVS